jgi:hypothetical protein
MDIPSCGAGKLSALQVVHISAMGFDRYRSSVRRFVDSLRFVTRFDCFRLFMLERPNTRYEDRAETHQ